MAAPGASKADAGGASRATAPTRWTDPDGIAGIVPAGRPWCTCAAICYARGYAHSEWGTRTQGFDTSEGGQLSTQHTVSARTSGDGRHPPPSIP